MQSETNIGYELQGINQIRTVDGELDQFTRGQIAGAQQALAWALEQGLEPIRAILTDKQIASIRGYRVEKFGDTIARPTMGI